MSERPLESIVKMFSIEQDNSHTSAVLSKIKSLKHNPNKISRDYTSKRFNNAVESDDLLKYIANNKDEMKAELSELSTAYSTLHAETIEAIDAFQPYLNTMAESRKRDAGLVSPTEIPELPNLDSIEGADDELIAYDGFITNLKRRTENTPDFEYAKRIISEYSLQYMVENTTREQNTVRGDTFHKIIARLG